MGRAGLRRRRRRRRAEYHPRKCGGNRKQRRFHRLSPSDVPTGRYSEIIIGVVGVFYLKLRTLTFFIRVARYRRVDVLASAPFFGIPAPAGRMSGGTLGVDASKKLEPAEAEIPRAAPRPVQAPDALIASLSEDAFRSSA